MGLPRKSFITAFALAGLATTSQAPEFAQQYSQRLGGAVEELRIVARDFDADALNSNMTRGEALEEMKGSDRQFTRDRGTSMEKTLGRFESLRIQMQAISQLPDWLRPIALTSNTDDSLMSDTWRDYKAALPLTVPGAIWGILGALILGTFASMLSGFFRRRESEDEFTPWRPKPVKSNLKAPPILVE